MFNLDMFFVSDPRVSGNKIVPSAEIPKASGIQGWNIFFVEPHAVENAVKALPEFQGCASVYQSAEHGEIYTTERKPRFVWEVAGKNYWVDDEGIAMRPRDGAERLACA